MIKNAVYNILVNDATLTAIVGNNIFPVKAPQETDFPFITIINNTTTPTEIKGAVSTNDYFFFQVDIYSETQTQCQTIAARVRVLLDQYAGTVATIDVQRITFQDEQDSDFDIELEVFAKSQDYKARIKR